METLENGWLALEVAEIGHIENSWNDGLRESFRSLFLGNMESIEETRISSTDDNSLGNATSDSN